ncbi:fidgetin-like protein 2 [Lates japonicus]|uniref:Fidgetin-like protein 2 n=1 Tax=Lates japonicus TaxID=270547 RepID=A0AAD3M1T1_LATJO|nr:fidgetin-like protein 2 [Lates japonicus]
MNCELVVAGWDRCALSLTQWPEQHLNPPPPPLGLVRFYSGAAAAPITSAWANGQEPLGASAAEGPGTEPWPLTHSTVLPIPWCPGATAASRVQVAAPAVAQQVPLQLQWYLPFLRVLSPAQRQHFPLPPAPLQSTPHSGGSYSPTTPVSITILQAHYAPDLAPSYSHPSATYLPSGLPAPSPVPSRPAVVGGSYSYQSTNLGTSESGGTLKRKAFEMSVEKDEVEDGSRYRKYSYDPLKAGGNSPYSVNDKTECRGNGISSSGSTDPQTFKPSKPSSQPLVSPQYGAAGEYSPPAGMTGENGVAEQGFTQQQQHRSQAHERPPLCGPNVETMKSPDPRLLDLVNGELLDCSPALGWGELAGLTHVKTALEEDLLWPVLRPSPVVRPPRTVLLFGPRGGGKTTLTRSLASQLGASFYQLSGAMLASKGKAEAEHILGSLLQVAGARQPSVVLLSQVEAMEEEGLRQTLLTTLEKAQVGTTGLVILVCATGRPDLLQDAVHRSFAKRYHVGLPDVGMRRQVLLQALTPQGCSLSERELSAVLQRTEGFSVWELLQLSQQALSSAASPTGAMHGLPTSSKPPAFTDFENAFCKVRPHTTTKELDTCIEWSKMYSH